MKMANDEMRERLIAWMKQNHPGTGYCSSTMAEFARAELLRAAEEAKAQAKKYRRSALGEVDDAKGAFFHGKANALNEWAEWLERRAEK